MFALGLQGSPRQGNTAYLLGKFMEEIEKKGVSIQIVEAAQKKINPCQGCGNCERTGFCVFDDEMRELFPLIRKADIIVLATPMYFFNATAQLKMVIDRSQAFWSRKYRFHLKDPRCGFRKGFMLAVGGSRARDLFDGIRLTSRYFFDAVDAEFVGELTYRSMEREKDMAACPTVTEDIKGRVEKLLTPLLNREKTILFAGRTNTGASMAAAAFAMIKAGERLHVITGGIEPGRSIRRGVVKAMAGKGIDLAFIHPQSIEDAVGNSSPDLVVRVGCGELPHAFAGAKFIDLHVPDLEGKSEDEIGKVCDAVEERVDDIIKSQQSPA